MMKIAIVKRARHAVASARMLGLVVGLALAATAAQAQDAAPEAAQPDDASVVAATKRMRNYLESTTSLTASFRSLLLDESREPLAESVGLMALKRPGRFRWEETAPEEALLVTNGTSLWNYDPELEQVVIQQVSSLDSANPAQLLGGGADLENDFKVVGGYRVDNIEWVDVRPRATTSDFEVVRFGFKGEALAMMEFHNKIGQITQYVLSDVVANAEVDEATFTFSPPPGTEIVDGS